MNLAVLGKAIGPVPTEDQSMVDCLATITERYFSTGRTLVFSWNNCAGRTQDGRAGTCANDEIGLLDRLHAAARWPIVVSCACDMDTNYDFGRGDKHGSYVLIVRFQYSDEEGVLWDVRKQMQILQSLSTWNPRARFVIMMTGQGIEDYQQRMIKALLKELSDIQVLNIIILVKLSEHFSNRYTNNLSDLYIYTWFPFTPPSGHCGALNRIIVIDAWMSDSHQFFLGKDLFESKVPENLGLCPLKVSTSHFPPFVIFPNESSATLSSVRGVEMDMLRHISEAMNASVVLPPRIDNGTDSKVENGTWTGPIGDLLYNKSDVALGAWCFTLEDSLIVDGTNSYFTEEFTFFIPRAEMYPRFLSMSRVFSPNVWLLIFVVMILAAVLLYSVAVGQSAGESDTYKYITNCLLSVWSVILGVGVHEMPRSDPLRGVFLVWLVFCLAINTVFQTYVTSYLVDPGYRYQIESAVEVIESGLEVYVIDFLHDFLSDNLLNQLKSWRKCGSGNQCLMAASRSPGVVMLSGKVFVEYKADEQNGVFLYHESNHDLFHFHIVMVLKKVSPFLDRMNIIIRRLVEGGFPGKFFQDIIQKRNMRSISELDEYFSMSVFHLQSAFVAMFIGMSLSLLLFFGELTIKLIQRRNQTKPEIL
jgi:hypothetical protein